MSVLGTLIRAAAAREEAAAPAPALMGVVLARLVPAADPLADEDAARLGDMVVI